MASLARDRITDPAAAARTPATLGLAGPLAALVVGACAMGASPIFVRMVWPEVGPFASAFWRVALALPLLYGWMLIETKQAVPRDRIGAATYLAGLAFAGDLVFWHLAILHTSIANATFLATMAPVVIVLITLLRGGRVGFGTLPGLALCLGGGALLVGQSFALAPGRLAGDAYGIVTACFFAAFLLLVARARQSSGAGTVIFVSALVTAAILLAVALALEPGRVWPRSTDAWLALGALALISQVGGQGLLAVALGRLPAVFSSLVIFLEAVFAAAAGWIVLGESLAAAQAGGGALILLGIWVARPRRAGSTV